MGFNSSAVIAGVLGSLLVVGIVVVVTNSNDVNAPAGTQTELMWGDDSAPLGLVDGWNTSVGTAAEREAAARHFHVTIADDDSLWKHNVFTPFAGKTLKMVGIDILKRNAFNTLIEYKVKQGNVAWTVEPGPHGVWGPMVEHIDGTYTGTSRNAGYASPSEWIENDYKVFLGHKIENDWGLVNATSWDKTTVVIDYQSYQKGHFIMTWQLPKEGEVEQTDLSWKGDGTNLTIHTISNEGKTCNEFTTNLPAAKCPQIHNVPDYQAGSCPDKYAYIVSAPKNEPCVDVTDKVKSMTFTGKGMTPYVADGCEAPADGEKITKVGSTALKIKCATCGLLPGSGLCVKAKMKSIGLSDNCANAYATLSFCHEKACGVTCALSGYHSDPCAVCYLDKCNLGPGIHGPPEDSYPE